MERDKKAKKKAHDKRMASVQSGDQEAVGRRLGYCSGVEERLQGFASLPLGPRSSSLRNKAAFSCLAGTEAPVEVSSLLLFILPRASGWSPFHSEASPQTHGSSRPPCLKNLKFRGQVTFCFSRVKKRGCLGPPGNALPLLSRTGAECASSAC